MYNYKRCSVLNEEFLFTWFLAEFWIVSKRFSILYSINRLSCQRLFEHLLPHSLPPSFILFSLFLCMSNFLHLNTFFLFHFILLIYFFQTGYNMIVALQSHSHPTTNIRMVCDLSFPAPQAMTDRWMKDKGRFNHNSETENHWCQTDRIQFHVCDWLTRYLNLSRN